MVTREVSEKVFLQEEQLSCGNRPHANLTELYGQVRRLLVLCDGDTGLSSEAGVNDPLTSSSKRVCFKIPRFPPLPILFLL